MAVPTLDHVGPGSQGQTKGQPQPRGRGEHSIGPWESGGSEEEGTGLGPAAHPQTGLLRRLQVGTHDSALPVPRASSGITPPSLPAKPRGRPRALPSRHIQNPPTPRPSSPHLNRRGLPFHRPKPSRSSLPAQEQSRVQVLCHRRIPPVRLPSSLFLKFRLPPASGPHRCPLPTPQLDPSRHSLPLL